MRTGLAITEDVVTSSQRIQQRNSTSGFLLATPCPGTALCREISSCTRSASRLRGICTQKGCTLSTTPMLWLLNSISRAGQLPAPPSRARSAQNSKAQKHSQPSKKPESFTERRKSKAPGAKYKDPQLDYDPTFAQ